MMDILYYIWYSIYFRYAGLTFWEIPWTVHLDLRELPSGNQTCQLKIPPLSSMIFPVKSEASFAEDFPAIFWWPEGSPLETARHLAGERPFSAEVHGPSPSNQPANSHACRWMIRFAYWITNITNKPFLGYINSRSIVFLHVCVDLYLRWLMQCGPPHVKSAPPR